MGRFTRHSIKIPQETTIPMDPRYPIGKFQPPLDVNPALRLQAIQIVAEAPAALRAAASDLSPTQLDTPYREGGWTVRQTVHHVPDSHMNAFMRFKLALTEDIPTIKPYLEARWAELADAKAPIGPSLDLLDALHKRWIALLGSLKPAKGSWVKRQRIGRGHGSGMVKTGGAVRIAASIIAGSQRTRNVESFTFAPAFFRIDRLSSCRTSNPMSASSRSEAA